MRRALAEVEQQHYLDVLTSTPAGCHQRSGCSERYPDEMPQLESFLQDDAQEEGAQAKQSEPSRA